MVFHCPETKLQGSARGRRRGGEERGGKLTGSAGPEGTGGQRMPEMSDCPSGSMAVPLEPFAHQVGGHTCMLRYSSTTLCKVLIAREHFVYEYMPDDLKAFTAEYRGVLDVYMHQGEDGSMQLLGVPAASRAKDLVEPPETEPPETEPPETDSFRVSSESMAFCRDSTSTHDQHKEGGGFTPSSLKSPEPEQGVGESSKSESPPIRRDDLTNWKIMLLKKQLDKMKERDGKCQFILLENVGARFRCPSVLDLKMGTRQHGDDATEEKVNVFTKRCQDSTSSTLGVRVCGLQVYQLNTGKYLRQDKYYGRTLDVEGFEQSLRQFLHNGFGLRRDLLPHIIAQIRQLRHVVGAQDSLRFYSSSLLIMYEGDEDCCKASPQDHSKEPSRSTPVTQSGEECPIVVRMIDFAHSTIGGFSSDKEHTGPDRGYLQGLDSLVKAFSKIQQDPNS